MQSKELIMQYQITTTNSTSCITNIINWINEKKSAKYFVCANPHSLIEAEDDPLFTEAMKKADLITPDGIGIVIASKILGGTIRKRITGSDVFAGLMFALNQRNGYRVFFLGSTEETLTKIRRKTRQDFPNIAEIGTFSPPFKSKFSEEDNRQMIEAINRFKPHVLWVGMTAPKQEKWIYQNKDKIDVNFIGAIGAVFDFYVGNVKRSHPFFLKTGLEWLPRLIQEPRRLWRRNFISNPKFLFWVIKSRLTQ
jgi:N-acetylglucosaminyldiphosphoundecaprenol N-acetyl-beta-D-mannosaminyltransferase